MAEVIGNPRVELEADNRKFQVGLDQAAAAFKATQVKIAAAQSQIERDQARVARSIQQSMDRISGTKPTAQLQLISQALDQMGGKAQLTDVQIKNLAADVERLAAAGGRVPKNLQGLAVPVVPSLGPAADQLRAQAQGLTSSLGPAGAALAGLGPAGLAAAAGLGAASGAVLQFVSFSGALSDLSDKTQLSTEFLQELAFAGSVSGVSMEESAQAALILSRNIGNGEEVFERLGLHLAELQRLSPDEQFKRVAEAIQQIPDPAEQAAAAMAAFGKSGAAILPLLRKNFDDLTESAHRLGVVLDKETIAQGARLDDAFDVGKVVLKSYTAQVGSLVVAFSSVAQLARMVEERIRAINEEAEKIPDVRVGIFNPPEAAEALPTGDAQKLLEKGLELEIAKTKEDKDALDALNKARREAEAAAKAEAAAVTAVLRAIDADLAKRREQRESFGLLAKSVDDASFDMGLLASQVERFGGVSDLSDTQLAALVLDLQKLQAIGGNNAFGIDTLNAALEETARRAEELDKNKFGLSELNKVIPVSTGLWTRYGDVIDQELENATNKTEKVKTKTGEWVGEVGEVARGIGEAAHVLAALGAVADETAQGFIELANAGAKGAESFAKFQEGDIAGGIADGLAAIGGVIEGIKDIFGKSPAERAAHDVGEHLGIAISDGLAEAIGADIDRLGSEVGARLLHLSEIIDEAGGVESFGFDKAAAQAHDLFSAIETGTLTVQEAGESFDKVFAQLIPAAIDKGTGIAKQSFLDLIELNKRFGTESQAVAGFLHQQSQDIVAGLEAVAAGAVVSEESAAGLGAAVAAAFQALRDSGVSSKDALEQLQATIDGLKKKFQEAGVDGGAAFDGLAAQSALLTDEVAGPLFAAIDGAAQALVGLANSNALTPEIFEGLTASISETFEKLKEEGKGGSDALALIAPDLQKIYELQQRFGFSVDHSTQMLLDQGIAAGLVGAEHESAAERMVTATERVGDILTAIAKQLGVDLPEAAQNAADGVNEALDGIQDRDINLDFNVTGLPDGLPGGGRGGRFQEFAGGIDEGPVRQTGLIFAHQGELVVRPDQIGKLGAGTINVNLPGFSIQVSGVAGTPEAIGQAVVQVLEGRVVPRLQTAIREAVG